jgi:hypothetical protein
MRASVICAIALAVAACGTSKKKEPAFTPVSEADFGRLSAEQVGPVQTARADTDASRDAAARARHRLAEARHEEGFARADRAQADADAARAAAEMRAAKEAGDGRLVARAEELRAAAALRQQAADARLDYARRLVAAREADIAAADARTRLSEAQLERAKLDALAQAGIPAATKYDPGPFERRVAEAKRAADGAAGQARLRDREAIAARDRWQGLVQRYEARVQGAGGTG